MTARSPGGEPTARDPTCGPPTFIVFHSQPDDVPEGGVYTSATSPDEALEGALRAAGDKDVEIFSADIGRQLLRAGRVDALRIHLVPVLLSACTPLFKDRGDNHIALEHLSVAQSAMATHLRDKIVKPT
jgi:dihydrofolate reductase